MKNSFQFKSLASLILSCILLFGACKKKEPTLEIQQEEYSKVEVAFTEGNIDANTHIFTANTGVNTQKVSFESNGKSNQSEAIQLEATKTYQLTVNFFDTQGNNVNKEFAEHADEHQIFFIPNENGNNAIEYSYVDENIGLKGNVKVLSGDKNFELMLNLRHGIDKQGKTYIWNDAKYNQYGETDFQGTIKLQTTTP